MFETSIVSSAAEGLDLLERIIDIIRKIFASLLGIGGSDDEPESAD